VSGCSEKVSHTYETRAAAEADDLFKKGWLPDIIPSSSRQIKTSNDLDTNSSEGEFYFEPAEAQTFLQKLSVYSKDSQVLKPWHDLVERHRKPDHAVYTYNIGGSIWIFFIHSGQGHACYVMKPDEKQSE
jgi:hypothetical protein